MDHMDEYSVYRWAISNDTDQFLQGDRLNCHKQAVADLGGFWGGGGCGFLF